jgi:hypothetical protein
MLIKYKHVPTEIINLCQSLVWNQGSIAYNSKWVCADSPTSQITLSKRSDNVTFSLLQRKHFTF